jgi:DNA repair ATPase RecN
LLSLPLTRFQGREAESLRPSLVFVDEIENGLDFKTLRKIFSFYQEHSGLTQILIVSHSPLVCNMVDPRDWRVAKRSGSRVTLDPPDPADLDLNSRRENLLLDNWEFYRRHISTKTRGG